MKVNCGSNILTISDNDKPEKVELKAHMASKPILHTPDFTKKLCVQTDASDR